MQTNKPNSSERADEVLHRIDETIPEGVAAFDGTPRDIDASDLEGRLRLLLPGHAFFRTLADDNNPLLALFNSMSGGDEADKVRGFEAKWTTAEASWTLAAASHGRSATWSVCFKADHRESHGGGRWQLNQATVGKLTEALYALGALRRPT